MVDNLELHISTLLLYSISELGRSDWSESGRICQGWMTVHFRSKCDDRCHSACRSSSVPLRSPAPVYRCWV